MNDLDTTDRVVSRAVRSWLHEDQHEDASRIAGAVLDRLDTTPQRRATWWPARRTHHMNRLVPIGLGAAAVIAVLIVGGQLFGPGFGGIGAEPTASPQPTASPEPTATPEPSSSPPASPPPLTESFTSQMHGISMSYPQGWTAQAATEPWTGTGGPHFPDPYADLLIDPLTENLFLILGSQPIGDSTPEEWVAGTVAADDCSATEPIAVDGATGVIVACHPYIVAVTTAGRGYRIRLYTPASGKGLAFAPYDRAWFEEVLATVQLKPEDALDVAP